MRAFLAERSVEPSLSDEVATSLPASALRDTFLLMTGAGFAADAGSDGFLKGPVYSYAQQR